MRDTPCRCGECSARNRRSAEQTDMTRGERTPSPLRAIQSVIDLALKTIAPPCLTLEEVKTLLAVLVLLIALILLVALVPPESRQRVLLGLRASGAAFFLVDKPSAQAVPRAPLLFLLSAPQLLRALLNGADPAHDGAFPPVAQQRLGVLGLLDRVRLELRGGARAERTTCEWRGVRFGWDLGS